MLRFPWAIFSEPLFIWLGVFLFVSFALVFGFPPHFSGHIRTHSNVWDVLLGLLRRSSTEQTDAIRRNLRSDSDCCYF